MNPRIEKISVEIEKVKAKLLNNQTRLRDLERQKTELENADILAAVRGIDVSPDEFAVFVEMFKAQRAKQAGALPDIEVNTIIDADKDADTVIQVDNGGCNDGNDIAPKSESEKEDFK